MKVLIIAYLFLFLANCGNGPAEERGKRSCNDQKLFILALINENEKRKQNMQIDPNQGKLFSLDNLILGNISLLKFSCLPIDDLWLRYYRGYIEGKK